ncbi:hypothetical protein HYC85_011179 [Camellia sinensis]|uniref:Uncharacterized protein n=1 Tax=Camellia sinensis TaxID=4442 RepID=A0A7J7HL14_CAMSI|nr:hypothetical protein HYC85_011179 [Camellia sinensis]
MGSFCEEEDRFFDTHEDITSVSDSGSDGPEIFDFSPGVVDFVPSGIGFEVWLKCPESIYERRNNFLKQMGLSSAENEKEGTRDTKREVEIERVMENSGAVLRNSVFDDEYSSSQSSMSYWSNEAQELLDGVLEENFEWRIKNLDDGSEFIVDGLGQDGLLRRLRKVGSNRLITIEEFERNLGLSSLIQQEMQTRVQEICNSEEVMKQVKRGWLRRLGAIACIVDREVEAGSLKSDYSHPIVGAKGEKVKVRPYRKRSKELSALYVGQDILAHTGSILTMKFSPDGQYLASAGEDGIVRVWQVIESERSDEFHVPVVDPSLAYFTVNHLSELVPLQDVKERKILRKASDAACVIFPQKVFSISEKPLHEFHGHCGDVLDLSWSKNKFLLSSSVDKTVRLWQVGSDQCLKVFSHNNYVTCVEFNPVDDNYFISGSIDGKVRIWAISGCQVVDWTDITEIVTAVCYHPDGKGGIVGSMTGNCRFYDASGLHNGGSHISASFTSDGVHILSASEDSNIYMWNYNCQDGRLSSQVKSNWSCERFFSNNVSVAIPWCGATHGNSILSDVLATSSSLTLSVNLPRCGSENGSQLQRHDERSRTKFPFTSPDFSLSHGLFSDPLPKGSATWPEEELPSSSSLVVSSAVCKSQYKFLKVSCQSMFGSPHAWGLVIVTGSLDGRIRSFQNYGLPIRV